RPPARHEKAASGLRSATAFQKGGRDWPMSPPVQENLMVRPVAANVVRISVDQMPLLLRRLEGVLAKERLYAQSPHVRSQEMSGPSSDAARGPSLTQNG